MSAIPQEQTANSKSPLRRLSSLANLNLNPWNRRRSHLISDTAALASSETALTMPTLPSEVDDSHPSSTSFAASVEVDGTMPTQSKSTFSTRRRSFVILSDESCHILPRSRTLSNLPVPIKAKGPTSAPKSRSTMMLPPSRIPTPKPDGRARLASATKSILKHSKDIVLQRSDTLPLLSENTFPNPSSGTSRTTAFKENLRLSPVKQSPRIDIFDNGFASGSPLPLPATHSDCSHGHRPYQATPQIAFRTTVLDPQSSPIRESTFRRPSTPANVDRYDSQSVLASISHNACRKRVSYSAGIKQHQLLTPRHPPTPPQPVAPLKTLSPTKSRRTRAKANDLDMDSDMSPCSQRGTPTTLVIDPDKVMKGEPVEYWCGRMSVLTDRYRNERFTNFMKLGQPAKVESEQEMYDRIRRAMQHLYSVCATEEAKLSFKVSEDALLNFLHYPLASMFHGYEADVAEEDWDDSFEWEDNDSERFI